MFTKGEDGVHSLRTRITSAFNHLRLDVVSCCFRAGLVSLHSLIGLRQHLLYGGDAGGQGETGMTWTRLSDMQRARVITGTLRFDNDNVTYIQYRHF